MRFKCYVTRGTMVFVTWLGIPLLSCMDNKKTLRFWIINETLRFLHPLGFSFDRYHFQTVITFN